MKFGDIADKGKTGALLTVNFYIYQKVKGKRTMVGKLISTIMMGGIGHFGYKGKYPSLKVQKIPETDPDKIIEEQTFP